MIKVKDLVFSYNNQNIIINIPYWEVQKGDMVFISGKSGSGKSTLINLLSGLLKPSKGSINIKNVHLDQLKSKQCDQFRANHIGLISQNFNLIPYLSVLENIILAQSFQNQSGQSTVDEIKTLMDRLHLNTGLLEQKAIELSIGQQQRVAIIRAMINNLDVLLADEPTSALDYQAKTAFIKLLKQEARLNQMTLLFISHDIALANHFSKTEAMGAINVI